MMSISFTKMNSQGNNFIVIDNTNNIFDPTATNIKSLCAQKSVDCDQLLLLNIKTPKNISCRIFNNDASEALQCGNGLRAIMLYLKNSYGIDKTTISIADIDYQANIQDENNIHVNMGAPSFLLDDIISNDERINIQLLSEKNYFEATVTKDNNQWSFSFVPVSMGNLHCIVFSKNSYDKREAISLILNDIFNSSSNISFILNSNEFKKDPSINLVLRVNERGAGWTKSCGSGAASAAAFMIKYVGTEQHNSFMVKVEQQGGILSVKWNPSLEKNNSHKPLYLSGPSKLEYVGEWSA